MVLSLLSQRYVNNLKRILGASTWENLGNPDS